MINKFFVYGTLISNQRNHRVINPKAIESIEPAMILNMELYWFKSGSFPCMIDGKSTIHGEVITIKKEYLEEVLESMDLLEGYRGDQYEDNLYNRKIKTVILSSNRDLVDAYTYMYNIDGDGRHYLGAKIKSGSFVYEVAKKRG